MLYYKYREPSETYYKELLYNELYFSSPEECNDPYDSKTFISFDKNLEKWKKLLEFTVKDLKDLKISQILLDLAQSFTDLSPLTFDELENHNLFDSLPNIKVQGRDNNSINLSEFVKLNIAAYKPPTNYFVSFSMNEKEPLMWSHYSQSHKGFCLIFKDINGKLKQDPKQIKKSIILKTPFGIIAPSTSFGIPDEFSFQKITYTSEINKIDAFTCFPEQVWNENKDKIDPLAFYKDRNKYYLEKATGWEYEQECRLIFNSLIPWLSRMHHQFSPQERLFHFEPSQLVGIILGARIENTAKTRIVDIIKEYQNKLARGHNYKCIIFDFVLFQSRLSNNRREMEIEPEQIFSLSTSIDKNNNDFKTRLSKWYDGWGLEFDRNSCCKKQVT